MAIEVPFEMYYEGKYYYAVGDLVVMREGDPSSLHVIEYKTGVNPSLTDGQQMIYPGLVEGGRVTSWDPRILDFGFRQGDMLNASVAIDYRATDTWQQVFWVPGGVYPYKWSPRQ